MKFSEIKKILNSKKVGIAGCGGLGSNCAVALARVGLGNLIIVDFDRVEESNLNRQYYFFDQIDRYKAEALKENIQKINNSINVFEHVVKLDPQNILKLFADCDIIIEAFDKAEMKQMIAETVLSELSNKYLICGVGLSGWGGNELIQTEKIGNMYIVGDRKNETNDEDPPLAPRVGAVANLMANVALELLLGKDK